MDSIVLFLECYRAGDNTFECTLRDRGGRPVGRFRVGDGLKLSELRAAFARGRPVLFLGAGPSMAQGGPSGSELAQRIREQFKAEGDDFLSACNDVVHYKGRRAELERFIHDQLAHLPISREFLSLLALPWHLVLTTNYDLAPDMAAGMMLENGRRIAVHDGRDTQPHRDPGRLHVFKILGSCDRRHPDPGSMQLSSTDLRMHYEGRRPFMQQLRTALNDRDLILLGTSLGDELIFDFYDEMLAEPGPKPEFHTYLVTPSKPQGPVLQRMERLGILWVEGTLEALTKELHDLNDAAQPTEGRQLAARGRRFRISHELDEAAPYAGRLIDALYPGTVFARQDEFYKRSSYSKAAFEEHWDFQREVRVAAALDAKAVGNHLTLKVVKDRLHDARGENPVAFALVGSAGSAKTMSALRLAHDWVAMGEWALLLDAKVDWFAPETTADFLSDLYLEYAESCSAAKVDATPPSLLIILDNAADRMETVRNLAGKIRRAQLKNVVILVTGTRNELPAPEVPSFHAVLELGAHVSEAEKASFRTFVSKTFPDVKEAFLNTILQDAEANTFWGMLYMAISSTQEPLELTILKHHDQLPTWAQDLLGTVATFQDLQIPAPEELLLRKYGDLTLRHMLHELDEGVLVDIVLRKQDHAVGTLSCLNNTIAHLIYDKKVRPKLGRHSDVINQATALAIRGTDEGQFLQDKLIERMSQERPDTLSREEAERVLRAAAKQFQARPVFHHHAKALMRIGKFTEAEIELVRAQRDLLSDERIENIHHSFGELYLKWAKSKVDTDRDHARQLVGKARDSYRTARAGAPHYAAHGYAKLLLVEAKLEESDAAKKLKLLDAVRECDLGRATARGKIEREMFLDTRNEAIRLLAALSFSVEEAREFARRHRTGQGFVVLLEHGLGGVNLETHDDLAGALEIVNEGLSFAADDPALNLWRARLLYLLDEAASDAILSSAKKHGGLLSKAGELLFEAKVAGSRGDLHQATTLAATASRISPDPLLSADHTGEDFLRHKGSVATYRVGVSKAKKSVIRSPTGDELEVSANPGDVVRLCVTLRGLLPETVQTQPSILGYA